MLTPEITNDGHLRVVLSNAGVKVRVFVHRLVAIAFIPNPNNYSIINHKDENPANNEINNLEWCTVQYNNTYNDRHIRIGKNRRKPVYVYDIDHMFLETVPSITITSERYNIPAATLARYITSKKSFNQKYYFSYDKV